MKKASYLLLLLVLSGAVQGFSTLGPSSVDCSSNFAPQVGSALEELGISGDAGGEMPPHFTEAEVESLLDVIEGEDTNDIPGLMEGFFAHKNSLRRGADFYDNQRYKVVALMRELGIPDHKMAGLPLHFTGDEYQSIVDIVQGQDYDTALLLIRGFVSHKVQISTNDVCLPGEGGANPANAYVQPAYNPGGATQPQQTRSSPSRMLDAPESNYFKEFTKIHKIW